MPNVPGETGMFRVGKNAQCAWRHGLLVVLRDGLEHAEVPVVSLEESTYAKVICLRHQQNAFAFFQLADRQFIELIRHSHHTLEFA